MKANKAAIAFWIRFTVAHSYLTASCDGNSKDFERPASASASYLGQQPPGETPELFAPGIVNTDAIELNGVVSPDGTEFFFTPVSSTMCSSCIGASWDEAGAGDVYWVDAAVIGRMDR